MSLTDHVVAIRKVLGQFSDEDMKAIRKARADYDAGTHEMCQQNINGAVILYSIPRAERTVRRHGPWFAGMTEWRERAA